MTRASIINLLSSPYIEMARLKGISKTQVIIKHALPNAWAPIANIIAFNLAYLIVGVVGVEVVAVVVVRVDVVAELGRPERRVDLRVVPQPHDGRAARVAVGRLPVRAGLDLPLDGSAAVPLAVRVASVDVAAPLRVERRAPGQAAGLVVVVLVPAVRHGARAGLRLPVVYEGAAGAGGAGGQPAHA